MPKLYKKISKRLAKKCMGGDRWSLLQPYATGEITEGVLIHTCRGYNEVISEITPIIMDYAGPNHQLKRGWYVIDLDIETADGGNCSLAHCCTYPPLSKEEVLAYFQARSKVESDWDFGAQDNRLLDAVRNGEDPFDENGCVKAEYKV